MLNAMLRWHILNEGPPAWTLGKLFTCFELVLLASELYTVISQASFHLSLWSGHKLVLCKF